jgi:hypothetical protein
MKGFNERIKTAAMLAMADDYEDFETVHQEVSKQGAESGSNVGRQETARLLGELIREGLAEAYVLSANPPYSQVAEYSPEKTSELWFYLSPRGKARLTEEASRCGQSGEP